MAEQQYTIIDVPFHTHYLYIICNDNKPPFRFRDPYGAIYETFVIETLHFDSISSVLPKFTARELNVPRKHQLRCKYEGSGNIDLAFCVSLPIAPEIINPHILKSYHNNNRAWIMYQYNSTEPASYLNILEIDGVKYYHVPNTMRFGEIDNTKVIPIKKFGFRTRNDLTVFLEQNADNQQKYIFAGEYFRVN